MAEGVADGVIVVDPPVRPPTVTEGEVWGGRHRPERKGANESRLDSDGVARKQIVNHSIGSP